MLPSVLIYGGAMLALAGTVAFVIGGIVWLGNREHPPLRAGALALAGLGLFGLGLAWPVGAPRTPATALAIDRFVPTDEFHEFHRVRLKATPSRVFASIRAVTPREIRWLLPLFWLRSPRGGLSPAERMALDHPILDLMTRTDFLELADHPGDEYVIGTVLGLDPGHAPSISSPGEFVGLSDPGYVKVAMNFHVVPEPDGWITLTTETRVACTDARTRRKFATYWHLIYPGSSIIRAEWLDAIRRRALASGA